MSPYYDEDGITIYHGDCREICSAIEFDRVVADPPYGINWSPDNQRFRSKRSDWWSCNDRSATTQMDGIKGDDEPFDPSPFLEYPCILWGTNHYANALPNSGGWLIWDKRKGMEVLFYSAGWFFVLALLAVGFVMGRMW